MEEHFEDGQPPWGIGDLVGWLVAAIASGFVLALLYLRFVPTGDLSPLIVSAVGICLFYLGALGCMQLAFSRKHRVTWAQVGAHRVVGYLSAPRLIGLTIGMWILVTIATTVAAPFIDRAPRLAQDVVFGYQRVDRGELVYLLLAIAVAAPVVEEVFFRGVLLRYLRGRWSAWPSIAVSAALFAAAHGSMAKMPGLIVMGVVLGKVTDRYGSVYPAVLIHALNNAAVVLLMYAAQSAYCATNICY